jgi:hypothetical protein
MTTPTPTDADVERVARAIMVASNAFGEMWIDPVAIARAAIAAMIAPAAARVRDLEEALRGEWLTIDSAPRDHALPAIWVADLDGCMEPVRWRWRTWKNIYTDTDIGFEPTHWCPTPSPPGALREGGNG